MSAVRINNQYLHKNSGKVFVVSSVGVDSSITGQDLGVVVHLYPVGMLPDDKNAMDIPVANVSKFFEIV